MWQELTPELFSSITKQRPCKIIWTLGGIARAIGASIDFVRKLTKEPDTPIRRVAGRWFVFEDELWEFLRSRHG